MSLCSLRATSKDMAKFVSVRVIEIQYIRTGDSFCFPVPRIPLRAVHWRIKQVHGGCHVLNNLVKVFGGSAGGMG